MAKRTARKQRIVDSGEAWDKNQRRLRLLKANAQQHIDARKNWKTNWETGSLAPRLDVGELTEKYGTSSIYDINLPDRRMDRRGWIPIQKGDRVVVTWGRERGQIGYVSEVSEDRQAVKVLGVNKLEVLVPDWVIREARTQDPDAPSLQTINNQLPIEHVKLIYPLPDPQTGIPRDVVIERLERVRLPDPATEDEDGRMEWKEYRVVAGCDIIIPWPELASKRDEEEFDIDTPRITVDEITFRPYLLRPPMPTSVIDELRSKYSRFRTRHDPEYEQKIEARAEREGRRKGLGKTMRTPLQELAELRATQKAAEAKVLSDEQLARLGEVMAQARRKTTQAVAAAQ